MLLRHRLLQPENGDLCQFEMRERIVVYHWLQLLLRAGSLLPNWHVVLLDGLLLQVWLCVRE